MLDRGLALDSSAIIHIAAHRPDHANTFRITFELDHDVRPDALQRAFDLTAPRFPAIVAGIRLCGGEYRVMPVRQAPPVRKDDALLAHMPLAELETCGMRVLYGVRSVSVEVFHSLCDGHSAIIFLNTLLATYLEEAFGTPAARDAIALDVHEAPRACELADDFPTYAQPPASDPNRRRVFQLPGTVDSRETVHASVLDYSAARLLKASRAHKTSLSTLLATLMLMTVADIQRAHKGAVRKPMQIAVPANARRLFGSETLRNLSFLALPCVEPHEADLPFDELLSLVDRQLKEQFDRDSVAHAMASYVNALNNPLYRMLPIGLKMRVTRLVHRIFGARNSCITVSNLGVVAVASDLQEHVTSTSIALTPRIESPYNCSIATHGDTCRIVITRFCEEDEVTPVFRAHLEKMLAGSTRLPLRNDA